MKNVVTVEPDDEHSVSNFYSLYRGFVIHYWGSEMATRNSRLKFSFVISLLHYTEMYSETDT